MTLEKLSLASITVSIGVIVFSFLHGFMSPLLAVVISLGIGRVCEEIVHASS